MDTVDKVVSITSIFHEEADFLRRFLSLILFLGTVWAQSTDAVVSGSVLDARLENHG
jgi:hypothetical protein